MPTKIPKSATGLEPGMVYAFRVYDGRFGAFQVLPSEEDGIKLTLVNPLNRLWRSVPRLHEVSGAKLRTEDQRDLGLGTRTDSTFLPPVLPPWAIPIGRGALVGQQAGYAAVGSEWRTVLDVWRDHCPVVSLEGLPAGKKVPQDVNVLKISVHSPTTLHLPATLETLVVEGEAGLLTVSGISGAFPFHLYLSGKRVVALPRGLAQLECLSVESDFFDARATSGHSELTELELQGDHGRLVHAEGLATLTKLRTFKTRNYYELDSANFPALDSIEYLSLRWLLRTDAVALKKKLRGVRHHLILGTRTDQWVAENVENPFRDWADENGALGRAATKAWKAALSSKRAEPERVLQTLIGELNRLDARHDLETHHREQAADAFLALAAKLGVPKRRADKIFAQRTF